MEKIVIGMSGGVDSSVAAYLLQKEGYDVTGVTVINMDSECEESKLMVRDAKAVADRLSIRHEIIDYSKQFDRYVTDNFVQEYLNGRTPNPCNRCNRFVKWQACMEYGRTHGIEKVATGHYAGIIRLQNGRYSVTSGDSKKDQAYALCMLTQEQLKNTVMPLYSYSKAQIRQIAAEIGISVAEKPDSQDICFIPDGDYVGFLKRRLGDGIEKPGKFISVNGEELGTHRGAIHYTYGQRKGLGLSLKEPGYVTRLDIENNIVTVGTNKDLFSDSLNAASVNYMGLTERNEVFQIRCEAKIRYASKGAPCLASFDGEKVSVVFDEPERAVTPGQYVVFYGENEGEKYVLASAVIEA